MRVFDSGHGLMRYHDMAGEGPPLIFLHGLGCASSCDYVQVAAHPALASRRRILVDLLGSGFSDRPADFGYGIDDHAKVIAAFVNAHCWPAIDLFGHSMGGSIAIVAARLLGTTVRTLLISEANLDSGGGQFSRAIAAYSAPDYLARGHAALVAQSFVEGSGIWAASLNISSPLAIHRAAISLVDGSAPAWRQQLYELSCHRAALFGSQSLPDADVDELQRHGIATHVIAGVGHSMAWQNPAAVAEGIASALA